MQGDRRNACKVFAGKTFKRGNRQFWRLRHKYEDNIETDRRERECECVKWNQLAQKKVRCLAFINKGMKFGIL